MAIQRNQISVLLNNITPDNKKYWKDFKITLKESTAKVYQSDIVNIMFFINKDIKDITEQDFNKYIKYNLDQGINAKAINRKLSAVNAIIKFLINKGVMQFNPLQKVKRLDDTEVIYEKIDLTWEQIQKGKKLTEIKGQIFNTIYNTGKSLDSIAKELNINVSKL